MQSLKRADFDKLCVPEPNTGCWLWLGSCGTNGYGRFKFGGSDKYRNAHRISYELHNGPIPKGLCVCHQCDVRSCVNPDHLFLGTDKDNAEDRNRKGRQARGENGNSKTTTDVVRRIRNTFRLGTVITKDLADPFGLSRGQVRNIVLRTAWRHV